jgi:TolB protein
MYCDSGGLSSIYAPLSAKSIEDDKMKLNLFLWILLFAGSSLAGISYEKKGKTKEEPAKMEKTAQSVGQALSVNDLSRVSGRLKVEGATIRAFKLFFPQPVVVGNASSSDKAFAREVYDIIKRDLTIINGFDFIAHTGPLSTTSEFSLLKQKGVEGVSKIEIIFQGNDIKATATHKNLITNNRSLKSFAANKLGKRRLAHLLAQSIYEEFIGPENIFLLQIAASKRRGSNSEIVMLDFDGHNEVDISNGPWDKFSPRDKFSPQFSLDGKSILYTVIYDQGQAIVEQTIGSPERQFRTRQPGINIDPRILPNNRGMLVTLSFENKANIYLTDRTGGIKGKLTDSLGLNLSPSIHPDGTGFAFVSDRSGSPQIYVQSLAGGLSASAQRLTFQGKYNQTPQFSPDGNLIAFTGRDEKKEFDIFLFEIKSRRISRITENARKEKPWRNEEPFFTPSGRFVVFTSEREGKDKPDIFIASLNGDHQFRITDANSDPKSSGYFSPVVRPKPAF